LTRLDTLQPEQTEHMEMVSGGEYLLVLWGFSSLYQDRQPETV
jgi:hypothetical protein